MIFREAKLEDIKQIQVVRNSVKENTLSNPDLVTDADCEEFLFHRGKGWVCEIDNEIVVFPAVDHRMLRAVAAARIQLGAGSAEAAFDLGHGHAAAGQVHAGFFLGALHEQGIGRRCGRGGEHGQTQGGEQREQAVGHGNSPRPSGARCGNPRFNRRLRELP